jgi:hypothetical protein
LRNVRVFGSVYSPKLAASVSRAGQIPISALERCADINHFRSSPACSSTHMSLLTDSRDTIICEACLADDALSSQEVFVSQDTWNALIEATQQHEESPTRIAVSIKFSNRIARDSKRVGQGALNYLVAWVDNPSCVRALKMSSPNELTMSLVRQPSYLHRELHCLPNLLTA